MPTIQRMEASDGVIRANVNSLMKLVSALENAGIELIGPGVASATGGRGVRLREHVAKPKPVRPPKASSRAAGAGAVRLRKLLRSLSPKGEEKSPVLQGATALLSTRSSSARRPRSIAVGVGGQPGMCRSTGITSATPPTTA